MPVGSVVRDCLPVPLRYCEQATEGGFPKSFRLGARIGFGFLGGRGENKGTFLGGEVALAEDRTLPLK